MATILRFLECCSTFDHEYLIEERKAHLPNAKRRPGADIIYNDVKI